MTNKHHNAISISLILLFALIVRVLHYHHILMSDEAQNMLTIKSLVEGEGIREYFFKHPPLFILLAAGISYPVGDSHHLAQGISIFFSVLSFIPLYLIVRRIFDERAGILALLFLAIIPLNINYSTWVKQDAMLLFFFIWSLYLYIIDRPLASGIIFGIASLTKEFAWFLIPIVAGWEFLRGWEGKTSVKKLLGWGGMGFMLSGWWYLFFGSSSFEAIGAAMIGGNLFEYTWHFPWYFYLKNLLVDLGMLLPLFAAGIFSLQKGEKRLPVLWFLAFYIPLSMIKVKAFWYSYLASPALAIICAVGLLVIWDVIEKRWMKSAVMVMVLAASAFTVQGFDSGRVASFWMPRKSESPVLFPEKEYLDSGRKALIDEGKVAFSEYNPALQYYLGVNDSGLLYLGPQFPVMSKDTMKEVITKNKISRLVLDTSSVYFLEKTASILAELCGEPEKIGELLIFNAHKLSLIKAY